MAARPVGPSTPDCAATRERVTRVAHQYGVIVVPDVLAMQGGPEECLWSARLELVTTGGRGVNALAKRLGQIFPDATVSVRRVVEA